MQDGLGSGSKVPDPGNDSKAHKKLSSRSLKHVKPQVGVESNDDKPDLKENNSAELDNEFTAVADVSRSTSFVHQSSGHGLPCIQKSSSISNGPDYGAKHRYNWGRTAVSICSSVFCLSSHLSSVHDFPYIFFLMKFLLLQALILLIHRFQLYVFPFMILK